MARRCGTCVGRAPDELSFRTAGLGAALMLISGMATTIAADHPLASPRARAAGRKGEGQSFLLSASTSLRTREVSSGAAPQQLGGTNEPDQPYTSKPEPQRTYPSLPGATRAAPDWLRKDAPFDVDLFFVQIPPAENAAPLYLDALYEFAPGAIASCVSPDENEARGAALREREARTTALWNTGRGVDAAAQAALLEEYQASFEKLAQAQKKQRCVFEGGFSLDAEPCHAQGARNALRLLQWRVELAVGQGKIAAALDDTDMATRLSRDLRPRGPILSQLVSVSFDAVIVHVMLARVISLPKLTVADCDRLLETLGAVAAQTVDPLVEGYRAEYVSCRDLLHRLEQKERLGDLLGAPGSSNGTVLATRLVEDAGETRREVAKESGKIAEQLDELLDSMAGPEFAAEVDALNRYFRPLVRRGNRPTREWDRLLPEQEQAAAEMKLLPLLTAILPTNRNSMLEAVEAIRRDETQMHAAQCLVALRRWQLAEPDRQPPNLLAVCKAAGMKAVPVDEYSPTGKPLRWTRIGGQFVIYSVGRDGQDDGALRDAGRFGRNPGDWIFWMPQP